jgi:hypothetical protein
MEASTQVLGSEEVPATPGSAAKLIREVRAKSRRQFSAEAKLRSQYHRKHFAIRCYCCGLITQLFGPLNVFNTDFILSRHGRNP